MRALADLHRHLDGSLRESTLRELAAQAGVEVLEDLRCTPGMGLLGRTVHAGEGRPPSEIRTAIEELGAQRIGHGTTLLDDPAVAELVRERGVVIEACLTSNLHTGVIRQIADHPLPRWLAAGVRACSCTDNTLFSATSSEEEHARTRALPGMTDELMERAIQHGHAAAFSR